MQQSVKYTDLVPLEWLADGDGSIWLECHRVVCAPSDCPTLPLRTDIAAVRALIMFGSPKYLDASGVLSELTPPAALQVDASKLVEKAAPEGWYVLLMTRLGKPESEPEAKARVVTAVGLLTAVNGRNMAWAPVFTNIVQPNGLMSAFSAVWLNPLAFPPPDLTERGRERLCSVADRFCRLPTPLQTRVGLALRWFEAAIKDDGVDAVLKHWIAIETMLMPDSTDIRPIINRLKHIHEMSDGQVKETFRIGRLFGLRSRIVHEGLIVPIHQNLRRYFECLFADLLLDLLGQAPERRAFGLLNEPAFSLSDYLF